MREKVAALVLLVVLGFDSATIGCEVELIRDGRLVPVLLGVAVILIAVVALLAMVPLVRLARDGTAMMAQARERGADGAWAAELERPRPVGSRGPQPVSRRTTAPRYGPGAHALR